MNRTIDTQIKSKPGKSASRFLAKQRIKKKTKIHISLVKKKRACSRDLALPAFGTVVVIRSNNHAHIAAERH